MPTSNTCTFLAGRRLFYLLYLGVTVTPLGTSAMSTSYVMFAAKQLHEKSMSYIHLPEKGTPMLVAIAYTVQCVYGGIHVHVITLLCGMLVTKTKLLILTTETKMMEH